MVLLSGQKKKTYDMESRTRITGWGFRVHQHINIWFQRDVVLFNTWRFWTNAQARTICKDLQSLFNLQRRRQSSLITHVISMDGISESCSDNIMYAWHRINLRVGVNPGWYIGYIPLTHVFYKVSYRVDGVLGMIHWNMIARGEVFKLSLEISGSPSN